ncbi:MAG: exopolysaccharide biosynthesis protein [Clostridium sp.]|nr:exopolysaccharide biosynthesis protein [Clostridium sp.]
MKKIDVLIYMIYILVFIAVTTPFVLFFGPYKNSRKVFVSTLLATRHAYYLTNIFSQDTLNNMMGKTEQVSNEENQDLDKIDVEYTTDNDVQLYKDQEDKYIAYILEIKNPLKIKASMTKYLGKMGQRTSEMAEDNDALAAINGGAFKGNGSYGGTASEPEGFVISDGKVIYPKDKYNENIKQNVIAFKKDGKLVIGSHSLKELKQMNVKEAMCFSERSIIVDGVKQIRDPLEGGYNPRTAVGQKADGTVIFLVMDGRKITMPGATFYDIQEIMAKRGAVNVGVLDGGYSSTMYYDGEVRNSPNAWDGERLVATAFYVEK